MTKGISLIITFYQGISSLKTCLSLLQETVTDEENFEIIIANDNPEINLDFLNSEYNINIIYMPHNMGYAATCNKAVLEARYDTLIFMDCDIYPTKDWLVHMKKTYADIGEQGCVSATIYETDTGNLFGYGMGVYDVDVLLFLRHGFSNRFSLEDRDVPIVTSGCMMVNRKHYIEIGGQDEQCMNIHCDVDFSFRMLQKGFHNRMCAKAKVYHRGQISGPIRTVPFRQDVKAYLFQKWGKEMQALCNTPKYLAEIWSSFDYEQIHGKSIIVVSVSNSLSRRAYIDMLAEKFSLKVLEFHDIKNIKGEGHILLQDIISWDICRLNVPIIYFTDDYRNLQNNYYWFLNRAHTPDLVCDKNGNLMYSSDSHFKY